MLSRPEYAARADYHLRRRGALAIVAKIAPGIATLATNLLIGRVGGAALLGLTQTATSIAALLALLYPAPAAAAASRFVSAAVAEGANARAAQIASYLARRVLFATACSIFILLAGALFLQMWNVPLIVVACVITLGISLRVFIEGLHFGGGESRRLAQWSVAIATIGVLGSGTLLIIGVRSAWVVAPVAVANFCFAVFSWPVRSSYRLNRLEKRRIRNFLALGALGTLASSGFLQATTLVGNATAGVTFAGEYAAGLTMTVPLSIVSVAISATLFPALSVLSAVKDLSVARSHVAQATSIIATVMGAATLMLLVLAAPIVAFVWGESYERTAWILLFLLTGTLATAVAVPSVTSLTSSSNAGMAVSAFSSLGGAVAGAVVWVITIPWAAEFGVMLGCLVATLLSGFLPYLIVWRRHRMRWASQTIQLVLMLACSWAVALIAGSSLLPLATLPYLAVVMLLLWAVIRRRDIRRIRDILIVRTGEEG